MVAVLFLCEEGASHPTGEIFLLADKFSPRINSARGGATHSYAVR